MTPTDSSRPVRDLGDLVVGDRVAWVDPDNPCRGTVEEVSRNLITPGGQLAVRVRWNDRVTGVLTSIEWLRHV